MSFLHAFEVVSKSYNGLTLAPGAPGRDEQKRRATDPEPGSYAESRPSSRVQAERVVERPLPRAECTDCAPDERDHQDVLVALARPEDEEAVLAVVRDQ